MYIAKSGEVPGLVVEGGANPLDGGTDPIYLIHFLKNSMKLKKFWFVGGVRQERSPLRSATESR